MTTPVRRRRSSSSSAKAKLCNIVKQGKHILVLVVLIMMMMLAALFTHLASSFIRVAGSSSDVTTTTATTITKSSVDNNNPFSSLRTVRLRSGLEMPAIGYGTCCRPSAKGEAVYESTKLYLKHGGRLIDTAMAYRNHKEIGRAIADYISKEHGISRRDIWITSKVAPNVVHSYDATIHGVDDILQDLGTDYLDLILIHSPKLGKELTSELWRGLIHVKQQGKARAIGVSNFNTLEIQDISTANHGVMPEVNQIQLHPWSPHPWKQLVDWGKHHGVTITAYTSLGGSRFHNHQHGDSSSPSPPWPDIVQQIAQRYSATPAQVMLQWSLRQGVAVIPGSGSEQHIVENLLQSSSPQNNYNKNTSNSSRRRLSLDDMTDEEAAAIEAASPPRGWFDAKRGPFKMDGTAAEIAWGGEV